MLIHFKEININMASIQQKKTHLLQINQCFEHLAKDRLSVQPGCGGGCYEIIPIGGWGTTKLDSDQPTSDGVIE